MHAVTFRMGDYHRTMASWWQQWHGNAIDKKLLSRFGVAVLDKTGPIALTHLYPTSTADIVWVGFTAREPNLSHYRAGKALKLLLETAEEATSQLGYSIVYTGFDAPALQKLCKLRGYHDGGPVREQWKAVR